MSLLGNKLIVWLNTLCVLFLLSTNQCLNSEDSLERHETTIVSTQSSLPLQRSLGYYSLDSDCKHRTVSQQKPDFLIISTLDGKLSALDVENGDLVWSRALSSEPLLSSTISDFEVTRKGRIVRIVPSLDGNLYLYNGKTIDGIPLNAETLLKSSYKLGDDLVITGGQESQVSGIDLTTGRVVYECGLKGCPSTQLNENETFDDLYLVKRITQTVRAIDPRNGRQKWYFSVTEPHISGTDGTGCDHSSDSEESEETIYEKSSKALKETKFKVIVPNGLVSAKSGSTADDSIRWNFRFDSPIVHVWHYRSGRLNAINLFDKQKLLGFTDNDLNVNEFEPSIYIGLYQHQWYVQSSDKIKAHISETKVKNDLLGLDMNNRIESNSNALQIEWKPQAIVLSDKSDAKPENGLEFVSSPQFSLSISTENEENIGYYIFEALDENQTKCLINSSEEQPNEWEYNECEEDSDLIQQIVIASLWHYWREVTAISIVSAFVLNFLFSFIKRKFKSNCNQMERNEEICTTSEPKDVTTGTPVTPPISVPFSSSNSIENNSFLSRYETDFEPIQVLGRGGFGLVFEAKHIIDESHYAVKRIGLPIRKEQREKVMREVRALSKLDHSGIVRYYNAWVELPPPGWQEDKDRHWDNEDVSETHLHELYDRDKQVVNKSVVSDSNISVEYKSNEMYSQMSVGSNKYKLLLTETQSNQSIDIVFDENVSSIKVIDKNSLNSLIKSNKTVDSNDNKWHSNDKCAQLVANTDSVKVSTRPNSLNRVLPRCYLYIQMQLCRKDTLKDWLFNNAANRDPNAVLDIFDQIVSAVHYVHSMGLMHRDLKPSNIFFSMDGNIKIGDFGLVTATAVEEDSHTPAANDSVDDTNSSIWTQSSSSTHTNRVGTQLYMSPEQIRNLPYSHKVDIFSLGIILFELLVPFKTEMERNLLLNEARKQIFPKDFCNQFRSQCDLLKKLLAHNPEHRPSTVEIKEHEVLKNLQSISGFGRQRSRTISLSTGDN